MFAVALKSDVHEQLKKLVALANKKAANPLRGIGADLMRYARDMVGTTYKGDPSKPGKPPLKRKGQLQRSIRYEVDGDTVSIGILKKAPGWYGNLLEFGATTTVKRKGKSKGARRGRIVKLEARPYMRPTLEQNLSRIPSKFQNFL